MAEEVIEGWLSGGGPIQSLAFHQRALSGLVAVESFSPKLGSCSVMHDYGCADGFGTAMLQVAFQHATVKGFDNKIEMIERAKTIWPSFIQFECKDLDDIGEDADLIWCSHTLEHHPEPLKAISNFRKYCRWLILLIPQSTPHFTLGKLHPSEWLPLIKPEPIIIADFETERKYGHERTIRETTAVRVIQGLL